MNDYDAIMAGEGAYEMFTVPKSSGGKRPIHSPCPELKEVQKALLVRYFDPLPVENHVGAYVRGRSVHHTTRQHVGAGEILHLDLKDFFTSTRRSWVRQWLRNLGYPDKVVYPLSALITVPIKLHNGHVVGAVPQGAPTSGAVTNHIAHEKVDKPIQGYLETRVGSDGFVYTRYADDLTLSFSEKLTHDLRRDIKRDVIDIIEQSGYAVNHDKVYSVREDTPDQAMKVMGQVVHQHLNVPKRTYRRLRAIVHNVYHHGFEAECEQYGRPNGGAMRSALRGELTYWKSVNEERMADVWDQFQEAVRKHGES